MMMHPLLAASVANTLFNDCAAAGTHRARRTRGPKSRGSEDRGTPEEIVRRDDGLLGTTTSPAVAGELVIRLATAADGSALVRLGTLDGDRHAGELLAYAAADHAVLVAEADGSLEAALALDGGLAVADPFRPTALHMQLLAMRAGQLRGDAPRHRRLRLGVLHPRTS